MERTSITVSGSNGSRSSSIHSSNQTMGSQMVSTGSSNCRLINRGDGSIGMGYQGRDMKGTSIASISNRGSSIGSRSSSNHRGGSISISISICSKLGGQMVGTSSSNY